MENVTKNPASAPNTFFISPVPLVSLFFIFSNKTVILLFLTLLSISDIVSDILPVNFSVASGIFDNSLVTPSLTIAADLDSDKAPLSMLDFKFSITELSFISVLSKLLDNSSMAFCLD